RKDRNFTDYAVGGRSFGPLYQAMSFLNTWYPGEATVDTTIVGGRVLMAGKILELDIDEGEVMAKARERSAALWERF
ncbi:MAG: hypothetical protein B7X11_00900, partial [Acidobacteria bacterium 37-65-4]